MVYVFLFCFSFFFGFFDIFYFLFISFFFLCSFLFFCYGNSFYGTLFFDEVSFLFVFLRVLLRIYCFFAVFVDKWRINFYYGYLLVFGGVFLFSVISFCCVNIFIFYFIFEFVFVLMFLFLLGWGYRPERLQSSFYMVFYTLVVSFPFLIYILIVSNSFFRITFLVGETFHLMWSPFLFLVFLVKLPVYGVHLWLPKAHVEAPVGGSMVLAGVLLKLGGYGLYRFSFYLTKRGFFGYLFALGLIGGTVSCFLCLRQVDLKSFVAYSSICHMGFGVCGLYCGNSRGILGFLIIMVAHGFVSSCLFYILYLLYKRVHTRSAIILKGVGFFSFVLVFFIFVFSVLNIGVPPRFSFFSELSLLIGRGFFTADRLIISGILLFFAGVYNIYFFVILGHGNFSWGEIFVAGSLREILILWVHGFPLIFFVLIFGVLFWLKSS